MYNTIPRKFDWEKSIAGYDVHDDPSTLYCLAVLGFFIPLFGLIAMCCFNCGSNLGPKRFGAFKVLLAATILGMVLNVILFSQT